MTLGLGDPCQGLLVVLTYYALDYSNPVDVAGTQLLDSVIASATKARPRSRTLGDICSSVGLFPAPLTPFDDPSLGLGLLHVAPYWSDQDNACEPTQVADQALAVMHGSPIIRFTGSVHDLTVPVSVPAGMGSDVLDSLELLVITGSDNLSSGSSADATATFSGGQSVITQGINEGTEWGNNTGHAVLLGFPHGLEAGSLTSITLSTHFGGGLSGDNWNVNGVIVKAALGPPPACQPTSATLAADSTATTLADGSKGIVRFTGSVHTFALPVTASQADSSLPVIDLQLTVSRRPEHPELAARRYDRR